MNAPNGSYATQDAAAFGYGTTHDAAASTPDIRRPSHHHTAAGTTLRRRGGADLDASALSPPSNNGNNNNDKYNKSPRGVVKKLDFMFPKVDQEFTVKTDGGGIASLIAYGLIALLVLAECASWLSQNSSTIEHISVDTSLGKRMRVNLNITFPGLACEDLHVDVMDVAGDSQLNIEDTMVKKRFLESGRYLGIEEKVESNKARLQQAHKDKILDQTLPDNYCGSCYGAQENDGQCCNTCDELLEAYGKKKWRTDIITMSSEQCIREGRDKTPDGPKRMKKGEGCNLSGSMTLNRVAGNFHIAMGEGIERNGRHIHSFVPDDTINFNASHIIHHLSFGSPQVDINGVPKQGDQASLDGVTKIVTKELGTTGLFQYFIKVVPTTYVGKEHKDGRLETNRYFFTERFRPLMREYLDDDHIEDDDIDGFGGEKAAVQAGHSGGHSKHEHHDVKNAILPGVFFIYEIYPFAVEVSDNRVPLTHLLIRLMATIGGVITIVRWADSFFFTRVGRRRTSMTLR